MSNWSEQVKNNPYFCILPFNHLHIGTTGNANLCCVANYLHPIETNMSGKTVEDIWYSKEYKNIRQTMLDNTPVKQCEGCYKLDNTGGGSDRQTHNKHFRPRSDDWDLDVNYGNTLKYPDWIDLRPGRFCNLGCRMCFVAVSSTVADEHKAHPELTEITGESWFDIDEWIDDSKLYESIQKIIPVIKTIKLAGGEPLFMPGVIKLLKWCVDTGNTHLHLDITTNGTRTQGKVTNWLKKFHRVDIQLSIDGIGYANDYIRHRSDWEQINAAYQTYSQLPNVFVNILATVQAYNAFELTNIINYWKQHDAKNNLIFNFVDWPRDMVIDILPYEDRLEIANNILDRVMDLSPEKKQQCRIDALVYRLQKQSEDSDLANLRAHWAKRTVKYDQLRHQDINYVNNKLAGYVQEWIN